MQVNIRSGKDQGSHYAFSQAATCTYGVGGSGTDGADSWGNDYTGGGADLSALTLVVPSGARAKAGDGSPEFSFSATVKGTAYVIDTRAGRTAAGSGLAKVVSFGATAVIGIDGRAADGTRLDATIQCNVILGPGGTPIRT